MNFTKWIAGFVAGLIISIIYMFICHGDTPTGGIFLAYLIGAVIGERAYEELE